MHHPPSFSFARQTHVDAVGEIVASLHQILAAAPGSNHLDRLVDLAVVVPDDDPELARLRNTFTPTETSVVAFQSSLNEATDLVANVLSLNPRKRRCSRGRLAFDVGGVPLS